METQLKPKLPFLGPVHLPTPGGRDAQPCGPRGAVLQLPPGVTAPTPSPSATLSRKRLFTSAPTQARPRPRRLAAAHAAAQLSVPGPRRSLGAGGVRGGERRARANLRGSPAGRARAPGRTSRPRRAWRRGRRAALTSCCCRLLTATAAADAALCRSSAAWPGRSRLRVNLRVRSPAIAGRVDPATPERASRRSAPRLPSLPTRCSGSGTQSLSPPLPRSTR